MNDNIVTTQRIGINSEVIQIKLGSGAEMPASLPFLERTFRDCFKNNEIQIIIDMKNVKLPPTRFIALLIEVTNQARRLGGNVKLTNVSDSTRNNLVTFSPITYLTIEDTEKYALYDFGENVDFSSNPPQSKKEREATPIKYEIKEPPIVFQKIEEKNPLQEEIIKDRIRVESRVENLYKICDFVTTLAEKAGFESKEIGKIKVTVYEACLNVVEHAYFSNSEDNWIEVAVNYDDIKFIIKIHDWGQGFDFKLSKNYDVEKAVMDRRTGGFGLHIIQRSVDDINYEADPESGNTLTLIKNIQ